MATNRTIPANTTQSIWQRQDLTNFSSDTIVIYADGTIWDTASSGSVIKPESTAPQQDQTPRQYS